MQLILGSTSVYRRDILENAGLIFKVAKPVFDEDAFKARNPLLTPKELAEALSKGKALSLKSQFLEDVVLGCDQLIDLEGEVLGKSHTPEGAFAQLSKMSGKTHLLYTSSTLVVKEEVVTLTTTTEIEFRELSEVEIHAYIRLEEPFNCAGSYKMEKAGLFLAQKIVGGDPSAIQGLSVMDLRLGLEKLNINYQKFWKGNS